MMKKMIALLGVICILLCGCGAKAEPAQVVATTLPVYEFASRLCAGTGITVSRLVTENVSCLHDYSLSVSQARAMEAAEAIVISGAGLEEHLIKGASANVIDSSAGIDLHGCSHDHDHDHDHEQDAHIWLSPDNAKIMAENICKGLTEMYPQHSVTFSCNLSELLDEIDAVKCYADEQLSTLLSRGLVTFHDGFSYFAEAFGLHILETIEEESGSEASAAELKHLIELTREHELSAVFVERNGSASAAGILSRETGVKVFALDMAMSGDSWFAAMYHNIDTIKEALG